MSRKGAGVVNYREFPVLYVDDEVANLRTFELAFRREFSIHVAQSGVDALTCIASQPVAVVLSDHRMPGITGTELLARVREMAPSTIRLLVTAYGDAATLAQAINDGCIYRYVPKPWDTEEMRTIVRQAIDLYALADEKDRLIADLRTLNRVSREVSRQLDLNEIVDRVQHIIVSDFGFDGATILECSIDGEVLRWSGTLPAIGEWGEESISITKARSVGLFESLQRGEVSLVQRDAGVDGSPELRALFGRIGAGEILILPLRGSAGLLGALAIDNRRGGRCFAGRDHQLLQGIAAQVSIAMDNAKLMKELRNETARSSGADSLAIAAALGQSIIREVQQPILRAARMTTRSGVDSAVMTACESMRVYSELLAEQRPVICDVRKTAALARHATMGLAADRGSAVNVSEGVAIKVKALPGRLAQLLIHLIELILYRGKDGAVMIALDSHHHGDAVVGVSSMSGDVDTTRPPNELDMEADSLRLAACDALAREIEGSLTIGAEGDAVLCRIEVRAVPG